jgi:hypothetical protein
MKVPMWVDLGSKEIEVELSVEDIVAALGDSREGCSRREMLIAAVNKLASVFRKLPDDAVSELTAPARATIAAFLREQAERFVPEER